MKYAPRYLLVTFPLAEADESGDLYVEGGLPCKPVFVEERLVGPRKAPSSLMVSNLYTVFSDRLSDEARLGMCQILTYNFFCQPIAPQRWRIVWDAASARARQNNSSPCMELFNAVVLALFMMPPSEVLSSESRSFEQNVRQRVNDIVTEDFLGSEWRRSKREMPEVDAAISSEEDVILTRELGRELIELAHLSPGEKEVLVAISLKWSVKEFAEWKGIVPSGARNSLARARRKLRRARGAAGL